MADLAVHYYFGQSVLSSLQGQCSIDKGTFEFALSGPDDWFYCFTDRKKCPRGVYMHRYKTGAFLQALAAEPVLFSYCAGYLCHYLLDAASHPYILARTGYYDGTRETRPFRGNHMAFERALDRWILEEKEGKTLGTDGWHPMTDHMLGEPLPESLRQQINHAYYTAYRWEDVFPDLLMAKQQMRKYLYILENPGNVARAVTEIVRHPLLRPILYSREYYQGEDILNLSHAEWHHPKDVSLRSTLSFPELMEETRQEAVKVILAVSRGDLSLIGNRSYLTGFDLDDIRNRAPGLYDLLEK